MLAGALPQDCAGVHPATPLLLATCTVLYFYYSGVNITCMGQRVLNYL
jgi:hypothetical protein